MNSRMRLKTWAPAVTSFTLKMESTDQLLLEVEAAFQSLVSRIFSPLDAAANSIELYNGAILTMENILQRLIVLQPLLSVNFPGITQVIQSIRTLVVELNAVEDEAQRQVRRCRGRPEIVITITRNGSHLVYVVLGYFSGFLPKLQQEMRQVYYFVCLTS